MKKRAGQLFMVVLLLLFLQLFDYSLNKQQLPSAIPVTGAAVSDSQTVPCAETSPCKSPANWKCQSNSRCYDYSDCLFQCPSTPSSEKKDEQQPDQACTCGDWQTIGGCGEQGCTSNKVPQSKSCTGGQDCKTENRCLESAQCSSSTPGEGQGQAPEGVKEGVNLVPELVVTPSESLKGGDTIEVTLYVKNAGTKDAHYSEIKGGGTSLNNFVGFYKDKEYGPEVIPSIYATVSLLLRGTEGAIKPGEAGKVQVAKQSVKIPEDFSGNLIIVAAVDAQSVYPETDENDNRPAKTITVMAATQATRPNLVPTKAEVFPSIESLPASVSSIFVTVANTGGNDAVAEGQFLENKISVLRGGVEICKDMRLDLTTIKPGESQKFWLTPKSVTGSDKCVLDDKNANYWVVVDVDTIQTGSTKGAITESSENDNKQTFQIKGPQQCSPLGAVEAGKYCGIVAGTWLTQKDAGQQCGHNFECKTELCIKNKCVTEAQKEQILKIVG